MTLVPVLAIVLCTLFLSKGEAPKKSKSPEPSKPSEEELIAELLAKLLAREEQNVQK